MGYFSGATHPSGYFSGATAPNATPAGPSLSGDLVLPSPFVLTGSGSITANISASGDLVIPSPFVVSGSVNVGADITLSGNLVIPSPFMVIGSGVVQGNIAASGSLVLPSPFVVLGTAVVSANISATGDLTLPSPMIAVGSGAVITPTLITASGDLSLPSPFIMTGTGAVGLEIIENISLSAIFEHDITLGADMEGAENQDFDLHEGNTKLLTITCLENGNAKDIAGASITFVGILPGTTQRVMKTVGSGVTITDGANGVFTIRFSESDTLGKPGFYEHQINLVDGSSNKSTVSSGRFEVFSSII